MVALSDCDGDWKNGCEKTFEEDPHNWYDIDVVLVALPMSRVRGTVVSVSVAVCVVSYQNRCVVVGAVVTVASLGAERARKATHGPTLKVSVALETSCAFAEHR